MFRRGLVCDLLNSCQKKPKHKTKPQTKNPNLCEVWAKNVPVHIKNNFVTLAKENGKLKLPESQIVTGILESSFEEVHSH